MTKRILVVDDDPGVLKMIRYILDDKGYEVIASPAAKQALTLLDRIAVDLVITDIIMPEMEGIEFIREIRKKAPALPILAISGGGRSHNTDFLYFAQQLGANGILPKPFRREELLSLVSSVFEPA